MTSAEIRQSFLKFFESKPRSHTIAPSSSLLPDAPNLLFTNAGMNQFVPIFLGQQQCPYSPARVADTQKCIRAGGKHNDLEDVGLDTYHHTFFEMLGNWSFGDYFKKEAIEWAWELLTNVWGFPRERLYATIYCPHMDRELWLSEMQILQNFYEHGGKIVNGDEYRHEFLNAVAQGREPFAGVITVEHSDMEAGQFWYRIFRNAGLDPLVHIVPGNKKDNFWMMGDTGPCGPCSEIHVDLTPRGDTQGKLVNKGSPLCMEIWNLVFIQFNAESDGTFNPLPARHVDTGMGFERVCGIMQCTKNFTDFSGTISNYESDVFTPLFRELEKLSGKKYASTLPSSSDENSEQQKTDIAFRVIADHIRTLSFAIADGIIPSNEGRGYVLRRILRRAVRYGRNLGFHEPFFYKLVDIVAHAFGDVFPEVRRNKTKIENILCSEEESFNKTLDRGIRLFENEVFADAIVLAFKRDGYWPCGWGSKSVDSRAKTDILEVLNVVFTCRGDEYVLTLDQLRQGAHQKFLKAPAQVSAEGAFRLYDTYGFPLDLTELMACERGLTVDVEGFEKLMEKQRQRARKDYQDKKSVVKVVSEGLEVEPTKFLGYENLESEAVVESVAPSEKQNEFQIILDRTPFYAESGGQVGDTGLVHVPGHERTEIGRLQVRDTQKQEAVYVHRCVLLPKNAQAGTPMLAISEWRAPEIGEAVRVAVDKARRLNIQKHHTVTHLFHWALHEIVSRDARQRGSLVAPDRLRFDFNHHEALTDQEIADIERLVNERIKENAPVFWFEMPYREIQGRKEVMQFFGDKYGDIVRIVQIGGHEKSLDGFSIELCGGTHTKATGEIGQFKITKESAIAAGIRRIEAACGQFALDFIEKHKVDQQKKAEAEKAREQEKELSKQRAAEAQRTAATMVDGLIAKAQSLEGLSPLIVANLGEQDAEFVRAVAEAVRGKFQSGVAVFGAAKDGKVSLAAFATPDQVKAGQHAGNLLRELAKICGGGGGGKPDFAQAGGKDASKLDEALAAVPRFLKK